MIERTHNYRGIESLKLKETQKITITSASAAKATS